MPESATYQRCQDAIRELKTCYERELATYGEEGLLDVKKMEDEAPAPSPCLDHYNEVVAALLAYEGSADDFDLGRFEKPLRKLLSQKQP